MKEYYFEHKQESPPLLICLSLRSLSLSLVLHIKHFSYATSFTKEMRLSFWFQTKALPGMSSSHLFLSFCVCFFVAVSELARLFMNHHLIPKIVSQLPS